MNVELPDSRGHSFKHTVAYITHDKRPEGAEFHPTTADRVEWAETRNMGGVGPETGWRVMLDTFRNRDALKAAAGVRKTKDAKAGPVYHFSLNWHPDERGGNPTKAEMLDAADRVLKVMGAEHLQAVMSAHTDTGHPHLHVVLSLVCPTTGRMHAIGKDKGYALDRWSHDFEIEGGQIFSHDRAAKYAEIERKKAAHPDPDDRRKHVAEKQETARAAANDRAAMSDQAKAWSDVAGPKPKSKGALLKERADALKAKHMAERSANFARYKAGKDTLWKQRPSFKAIASQHRGDTRPAWSAFGKYQAAERKKFHTNERAFLGVIANAAAVIERQGWQWGMKGYLAVLFKAAAEPSAWRHKVFMEQQADQKAEFAKRMNLELDVKIARAKADHAAKLDTLNTQYDTTKRLTAARHEAERVAMATEWKDYWDRREKAGKRGTSRGPAVNAPSVDSAKQIHAGKTVADSRRRSATGNSWTKAVGPKKPAPLRQPWGQKAKPIDRRPRDRARDDFEPEI